MRHSYANYPAESGVASPSQRSFAQPLIVAQSGIAVANTGTLAEAILAAVSIPGGLLGINGSIRITPLFSSNNNANIKNAYVKLGGVVIWTYQLTGTTIDVQPIIIARNRGAFNVQSTHVGSSGTALGQATSAPTATAIDTSLDKLLTFSAVLTNIADTITLEGYIVEILPGA